MAGVCFLHLARSDSTALLAAAVYRGRSDGHCQTTFLPAALNDGVPRTVFSGILPHLDRVAPAVRICADGRTGRRQCVAYAAACAGALCGMCAFADGLYLLCLPDLPPFLPWVLHGRARILDTLTCGGKPVPLPVAYFIAIHLYLVCGWLRAFLENGRHEPWPLTWQILLVATSGGAFSLFSAYCYYIPNLYGCCGGSVYCCSVTVAQLYVGGAVRIICRLLFLLTIYSTYSVNVCGTNVCCHTGGAMLNRFVGRDGTW